MSKSIINDFNNMKHANFIISRLDKYITDANIKGNLLLGINTLICGGILSNYSDLSSLLSNPCNLSYFNWCLVIIFLIGITVMILTLSAVYPFLLSGNSSKEAYHSNIFFGSISEYRDEEDFFKKFIKQNPEEVIKDFSKQIFTISRALKRKYKILQYAVSMILLEIIFVIILFIIIGW